MDQPAKLQSSEEQSKAILVEPSFFVTIPLQPNFQARLLFGNSAAQVTDSSPPQL